MDAIQPQDQPILMLLPIDLLECVTRHLPGRSAYNLFYTYNKELQNKLGPLGGIKRVYCDESTVTQPHRFHHHFLPQLSRLIRFSSKITYYLPGTDHPCLTWFAKLPDSLIYLYWDIRAAHGLGEEVVWRFPPSLISLHLSHLCLNQSVLLQLPCSIRHLSVGYMDAEEDLEVLNRDLETLNLDHMEDKIELLPPNLTHLRLTFNYDATLPLKNLKFWAGQSNGPGHLAQLPRGLTDITLELSCGLTPECLQALPSTLTRFVADSYRSLSGASVAALPRSLTSLTLSGLDWFGIGGDKAGNRFRAEYFPLLPPDLTQLTLYNVIDLSKEEINALPKKITELHLVGQKWNLLGYDTQFPPALTRLKLWNPNGEVDQSFLLAVPDSVTHLDLTPSIFHLNDSWLCKNEPIPEVQMGMSISSHKLNSPWPRNLLHLSLSNIVFHPCHLKSLPTALLTLEAEGIFPNFENHIGDLPRSLTSLTLRIMHSNINDDVLELLPHHLEICKLPEAFNLPKSCVFCFPASVHTLQLPPELSTIFDDIEEEDLLDYYETKPVLIKKH